MECFRVFAENVRESIGMLNIRLREIPFWNARQSGTLKPHWYKLFGVSQEYKSQKPELYLCVTIGDRSTIAAVHSNESARTTETQCSKYKELPVLSIFVAQLGLGIQAAKNNVIKLGSDGDDCREFIVKINIKYAEHLENLLSLSAGGGKRSGFAIEYRLFSERCVDAVQNELTGRYSIDETMTIAIQSSWPNILKYFRQIFYIDVHILHDDAMIGSCKLSFGNGLMNLPASLDEFEAVFASEDCTFCYDDHTKIVAADSAIHSESFLHYTFRMHCANANGAQPSKSNRSLPVPTDRSHLSSTTPLSGMNLDGMSSAHGEIDFKRIDSGKTIPRTFSYNLALIDCTFQRRPNPGIWQFRYGVACTETHTFTC